MEIPWGGSCTQLYSSEMGRCFWLMSCKYRLVKNAHFQIFLCTDRAEAQPVIKRFVVSHAVGLLCRGPDSSYSNGKSEGLSVCCWGQRWFALLFFCITCSTPVVTLPPDILFLSCIRSSSSFASWAQSPARCDPWLCRCHLGGDTDQCQLLNAEVPALGPAVFGRCMGRSTALVHGARSPKLLLQDLSEAAAASQQCQAASLPWETACLWHGVSRHRIHLIVSSSYRRNSLTEILKFTSLYVRGNCSTSGFHSQVKVKTAFQFVWMEREG